MKKIHVTGSSSDGTFRLSGIQDSGGMTDSSVNTLMQVLRKMDVNHSDVMIWDVDSWDTKVWG